MNPNNIKQSIQAVIDGLTPLAQKLGVPLGQLWEVMVRQNYVYAVYNIVYVICGVIMLYGAWKWNLWIIKRKSENSFSDSDIGYIGVIIISILASVIILTSATEAIGRFVNPPYYIIQDITHLIQSSTKGT